MAAMKSLLLWFYCHISFAPIIQQHHRQVQSCQQICHLVILACFKFWPVTLSVQHDAHTHLVALISTPPSGGFFIAHLLQSCNLWPWQFPLSRIWLFTKLLFTIPFPYSPNKHQHIKCQYRINYIQYNHCIFWIWLCGCVNHLSPNILNALIYCLWLCLFVLRGT